MTYGAAIFGGIAGVLSWALIAVAVMWLCLRTGHGAGVALAGLVLLIATAVGSVVGLPYVLAQGMISTEQYIVLAGLSELPAAILLALIAFKSWPNPARRSAEVVIQ